MITCPVQQTLYIISNKWNILIIYNLLSGKKRFFELKKSLEKISSKVLIENLNFLIQAGLIKKNTYYSVPIKTEYMLTELGFSLVPVLDELFFWGENYKQKHFDNEV